MRGAVATDGVFQSIVQQGRRVAFEKRRRRRRMQTVTQPVDDRVWPDLGDRAGEMIREWMQLQADRVGPSALARRLRVNDSTVSRVRRGERQPGLRVLVNIMNYMPDESRVLVEDLRNLRENDGAAERGRVPEGFAAAGPGG